MKLPTFLFLICAATPVLGQTPSERQSSPVPAPHETDKVIPEKQSPPLATQSPGPDNLSDKLQRSNGVIQPPANVDPEIRKAPPPTGENLMPVIPPPGSPGGDQRIQPQ